MLTSQIIRIAADKYMTHEKKYDRDRQSEYLCCAVTMFFRLEGMGTSRQADRIGDIIQDMMHEDYGYPGYSTWLNCYVRYMGIDRTSVTIYDPDIKAAKAKWINHLITRLEARGD